VISNSGVYHRRFTTILGTSDEHYWRIAISRDGIELTYSFGVRKMSIADTLIFISTIRLTAEKAAPTVNAAYYLY